MFDTCGETRTLLLPGWFPPGSIVKKTDRKHHLDGRILTGIGAAGPMNTNLVQALIKLVPIMTRVTGNPCGKSGF